MVGGYHPPVVCVAPFADLSLGNKKSLTLSLGEINQFYRFVLQSLQKNSAFGSVGAERVPPGRSAPIGPLWGAYLPAPLLTLQLQRPASGDFP